MYNKSKKPEIPWIKESTNQNKLNATIVRKNIERCVILLTIFVLILQIG